MGLGVLSPKRIIYGLIFTSFILAPFIADPKTTFEWVIGWVDQVQPYVVDLIGGVI